MSEGGELPGLVFAIAPDLQTMSKVFNKSKFYQLTLISNGQGQLL